MPTRLEELCVQKGLKMTEQRRVISRVLSEATDHPDVEQVYRRAVEIDPLLADAHLVLADLDLDNSRYDAARERIGALWGTTIPPKYGRNLTQMLHAMETGEMTALHVIGENPAHRSGP